MFNPSNGMRPAPVPKTLILLTDGRCLGPPDSTECSDANHDEIKQKFNASYIPIFGIGVQGRFGFLDTQLRRFLQPERYFPTANFSLLTDKTFVRKLAICDGMHTNHFIVIFTG